MHLEAKKELKVRFKFIVLNYAKQIAQVFFCKIGQEHPLKKLNQNLQNSNRLCRSATLH